MCPQCEKVVQFDSFACSCPDFPTPFSGKGKKKAFFPTVYSCLLCHRLTDHISMGLFRGSLFCSMGFPGGSVVKNPPANAGDTRDTDSIPGLRRSPGRGNSNPLQHSCLENPMDKGTWYCPWGHKELDKAEHACILFHRSVSIFSFQ